MVALKFSLLFVIPHSFPFPSIFQFQLVYQSTVSASAKVICIFINKIVTVNTHWANYVFEEQKVSVGVTSDSVDTFAAPNKLKVLIESGRI
jgi:hypothetical protein